MKLMLVSMCVVMAVSYIVAPISGHPNPDPAPAPLEPATTALLIGAAVTFGNGALTADGGSGYKKIGSGFENIGREIASWFTTDNTCVNYILDIDNYIETTPKTQCWEHYRKGKSKTYDKCDRNLKNTDMNDKISSCNQDGVWIYYGDHFKDDVHVQITSGYFNVFHENDDKWSSLRYVGVDDYEKSSWTLYEDHWFEGDKTYVGIDNVPSLGGFSNKASSLITIGLTGWTFYSGENYEGECFFVRGRGSDQKRTASVLISLSQLDHQLDMNDKISSVRKGRDRNDGCYTATATPIGSSGGLSQNK